MKTLQISVAILTTFGTGDGCPFAKTTNDQSLRRSLRRRLSDTPEAKGKLKAIIDNRTKEQQKYRSIQQNERSIGGGDGQAVSILLLFSPTYYVFHSLIIYPYSSHTYEHIYSVY